MATRSTVIGNGTTTGTGWVTLFTCPAGYTALVKTIVGGFEGAAIDTQYVLSVAYQPSGGPVIPILSASAYNIDPAGRASAGGINIWLAMLPGDVMLISDDGLARWNVTASGALLVGVATD